MTITTETGSTITVKVTPATTKQVTRSYYCDGDRTEITKTERVPASTEIIVTTPAGVRVVGYGHPRPLAAFEIKKAPAGRTHLINGTTCAITAAVAAQISAAIDAQMQTCAPRAADNTGLSSAEIERRMAYGERA